MSEHVADAEPERPGCPLLELPHAVLVRIAVEAATSSSVAKMDAKPLCRTPLEAELLAATSPPPFVPAESVLRQPLRFVCRSLRRIVDEEVPIPERVGLDVGPMKDNAPVDDDDGPEIVEMGNAAWNAAQMEEDPDRIALNCLKSPGLFFTWLARRPAAARRRVRAMQLRLLALPGWGAARLRALAADGELAAGLEELDVLVPPDLRWAPVRSLRHLASLRSLRSLRVASACDNSPSDGEDMVEAIRGACLSLAALRGHPRLAELEVRGIPFPCGGVPLFASLPALRALSLSFTPDSTEECREALAALGRLTALERLSAVFLIDGDVEEEDVVADQAMLAPLSKLTALQSLRLGIMVRSVAFLQPLTALRHLDLDFDTDVDVTGLAAHAARLETLALDFEFEHSFLPHPGYLDRLVPRLTRLEALRINGPQSYFKALSSVSLAPLARLRVFELPWDPPRALVTRVATELPALQELSVRGRLPLSEAEAAALRGRLRRLRIWTAPKCRYTAKELAAVRAALAGVRVEYGCAGVKEPPEDPLRLSCAF